MKIAVMTLTRDRLDYTKHCFSTLREHAGCDYTHFVLDNGSEDGTVDWLEEQLGHEDNMRVIYVPGNVGIARGLNILLGAMGPENYNVIVHFDNDCELVMPNTIRDVAQLAYKGGAVLSPRILGLNNPPQATREVQIDGELILDVPQIGGICLTAPSWWYDGYRYPEDLPVWGFDDAHLCQSFRENGGTCGYVKRLEAWHYEGTNGQHARYPEYFERTRAEGKAFL